MTAPVEPAPDRVSGWCTWCGEWVRDGVVVGEVERDAGASYTLVRCEEHVGLPKPVRADRPRTHSG
jgi:hypothetical protein